MTFDKSTELPRGGAADQNSRLTGSSEWNGMLQLNQDEKKFFTDLNSVMVNNKQLPSFDITDSNGTNSGHHKEWEHGGPSGDPKSHRSHPSTSNERHPSNSRNDQDEHDGGHCHHEGHSKGSGEGDAKSAQNLTPDAVRKELNQDISNISSDLKSMNVSSPFADEMINALQQLANKAVSEAQSQSSAGTESPVLGSGGTASGGTPITVSDSNPVSSSSGPSSGTGSEVTQPVVVSDPTPSKTTGTGSDTLSTQPIVTGIDNPPAGGSTKSGGDSGQSSITPTGKFVAKNGLLYDPDGKEFIPNGLNVDSRQALNEADQLVNQYHFNFMRIGFNGMVNSDGTPNLSTMDQIASKYSKMGVPVEFEYPITDNQSVLTGSALQKAESWYSQVAGHFKDNPYVFLATPNESGDGTTNNSQWLTQTKGILSAVKDSGNDNPIVVDDTHWSGASVQGDPSQSGLIKYASQLEAITPNLVAAEHDYSHDSESQSADYLSKGISALKAAGFTPFVQEFGPYNFGGSTQPGGGVDAVLSKSTMEAGVGYNGYTDTYGYSAQSEKNVAGPQDQDVLIKPDGTLSAFGQQVVAQNEADQKYLTSL